MMIFMIHDDFFFPSDEKFSNLNLCMKFVKIGAPFCKLIAKVEGPWFHARLILGVLRDLLE